MWDKGICCGKVFLIMSDTIPLELNLEKIKEDFFVSEPEWKNYSLNTQVIEKTWPNTCYGLPGPDENCADVMVPGYEVSISAVNAIGDAVLYVYRTDKSGNNFRVASRGHAIHPPLSAPIVDITV